MVLDCVFLAFNIAETAELLEFIEIFGLTSVFVKFLGMNECKILSVILICVT
jgi:hypothetical protein